MKKYLIKAAAVMVFAIGFACAANAQFVVRVRPATPILKVRPACPSPRHVWVDGNHVWRNNQYVWTNGYWAIPPSRGHRWANGHWKKNRGGWVWVPGRWRR
jgi:hypothetical protein